MVVVGGIPVRWLTGTTHLTWLSQKNFQNKVTSVKQWVETMEQGNNAGFQLLDYHQIFDALINSQQDVLQNSSPTGPKIPTRNFFLKSTER